MADTAAAPTEAARPSPADPASGVGRANGVGRWDSEVVDVELLVVEGCPSEQPALEVLRRAGLLAGLGELAVRRTVVATQDEAERLGFAGSPTFAVAGKDLLPTTGASPGLTCRLYATATGHSGIPSVEALRDALLRECASRANAEAVPERGAGAGRAR